MKKDMIKTRCDKCLTDMIIHKSWKDGPDECEDCRTRDSLGIERFRALPTFIKQEGCLSCGHANLGIDVNTESFYITSSCPKCFKVRKYGISGFEFGIKVRTELTPFMEDHDI